MSLELLNQNNHKQSRKHTITRWALHGLGPASPSARRRCPRAAAECPPGAQQRLPLQPRAGSFRGPETEGEK